MCDFKFEFNTDVTSSDEESTDKTEEKDATATSQKKDCKENQEVPPLRPAREICIDDRLNKNASHCPQPEGRTLTLTSRDVCLSYINPEDVEASVQRAKSEIMKDIEQAISLHSDLVPCIYEGGLKVWECSLDLVHYMTEQRMSFCGQLVLELGCGAGLPGLYAMMKGAEVHFQDYNEEALLLMTIPNVKLNSCQNSPQGRCRFFAGDWSLVQKLIHEEQIRYDVILTSETIYSIAAQPRLYNIIRRLLKPSGKVYIAAKTHYFGVGGGTRQFEEYVREQGEFEVLPCKVISQGLKREILEMRFLQGELKGRDT